MKEQFLKHEERIKRMLKLPDVRVVYSKDKSEDAVYGIESEGAKYIYGRKTAILGSASDMGSLAHELFHAWQFKRMKRYGRYAINYTRYNGTFRGYLKYRLQRIELEAELFSIFYCIITGHYTIAIEAIMELFIIFFVSYLRLYIVFSSIQGFFASFGYARKRLKENREKRKQEASGF